MTANAIIECVGPSFEELYSPSRKRITSLQPRALRTGNHRSSVHCRLCLLHCDVFIILFYYFARFSWNALRIKWCGTRSLPFEQEKCPLYCSKFEGQLARAWAHSVFSGLFSAVAINLLLHKTALIKAATGNHSVIAPQSNILIIIRINFIRQVCCIHVFCAGTLRIWVLLEQHKKATRFHATFPGTDERHKSRFNFPSMFGGQESPWSDRTFFLASLERPDTVPADDKT